MNEAETRVVTSSHPYNPRISGTYTSRHIVLFRSGILFYTPRKTSSYFPQGHALCHA